MQPLNWSGRILSPNLCGFPKYKKVTWTHTSDDKWHFVKKQKLLLENKPLKKFLKKLQDDESSEEEGIVKKTKTSYVPQEEEEFSPYIPEENFMNDYHEDIIKQLWDQQQEMVDFLEKHGAPLTLAHRILIIWDDMVGSDLFNNKRDNFFKKMNANRRHVSISMLMVSQAYREIMKSVRTMFSCLVLFDIASDKELEAIYEEYPMHLKRKDWDAVYQYCTAEEYNFLFYNIQKPKDKRIMKNFSEYISTKKLQSNVARDEAQQSLQNQDPASDEKDS